MGLGTTLIMLALSLSAQASSLPPLNPGERLVLAPGTYYGPWEIDQPGVHLVAEGVVLDGGGQGSALILAAPGIVVEGLTVRNVGHQSDFYAPDAAVWLVECLACRLEGLVAEGVTTGVRIEGSLGAVVRDAYLTGTAKGPGITIFESPGAAVLDSYISNFLDGIYLERADNTRVIGNVVNQSARYGLHLMFSHNVELAFNQVLDNRVGSALMFGTRAHYHHNVMRGHQGPLAFGLLVQELADSLLEHNTIVSNTIGILAVSAEGNTFQHNELTGNGFGLLIQRAPGDGASSALLSNNRFLNNLYDVAIDDPEANVTLYGNAFDRASPLDLQGDGVSDLPYLPSSTFAILASRQPDLTIFALSPGILLWEQAEAAVPGLRLMTLADHAAWRLTVEPPEGDGFMAWSGWLLVALALGGWRWLR
ncbi:MAG: right-handed parallel beta-helix repeat-containing protein [Truepera sp.]|nr:right-handed parallel beta-helix repeat-containing protein [Truepera sp.]